MTTTVKYTLLRSRGGNYLAWFEKSRMGLDWTVTPIAQQALNFYGNPNVLDTAKRFFKKPQWKVVEGTLTWKEK